MVGLVAIGLGLIALAAAIGIGLIGSKAVKAMSRQPEAAGRIQTAAIIFIALLEGVILFALGLAFLLISRL